ncbi:diaminopimelate epimerase [Bacillus carboniphilus]|uniref:Diaminopimelate epimerase n=1 Tax=Bacillus carboniphilus TaxID=86663 RepID=A0ABY9JPF7_9BACI|nr:diaminopimelate epimerase [Bacillus carboniphilus]WLR41287.1 diaminopimelate epimerase [Bacillus carboniphilus]
MKTIQFTKMHGLGNNYIYIDLFKQSLQGRDLSLLAQQLSCVKTGIGADGMILIAPSQVAPVKMRIFNKDGSEGKNCGNGLRCVAKYVYEHKIVTDNEFLIETLSGCVVAKVEEKEGTVISVTINMGKPIFENKKIPFNSSLERTIRKTISFNDQDYDVTILSMGNPHIIFYVDDILQAPVTTLGPIVEKDERFPEGVNVEFVEVVNEGEISFRVWERGSGVTEACGTGACAAVVSSVLNQFTNKNKETVVHLDGGDLFITWRNDGDVWMKGPAVTVCEGVFYINQEDSDV